jgi:hypothetical protein
VSSLRGESTPAIRFLMFFRQLEWPPNGAQLS